MENDLKTFFDQLIKIFGGKYISVTPGHPDKISNKEYGALVMKNIMFKVMTHDKYLSSAGIANDWPHGRGCYISSDE